MLLTLCAGKWHVGAKRAYDLFPGGLCSRLKTERRKRFDEHQRAALTEANAAVAAFSNKAKPPLGEADKKLKEELESRVKLLTDLADKYEDSGTNPEVGEENFQPYFWYGSL